MKVKKILKDILLELKRKYSHQWKQYEPKTLEIFRTITKLLLEENPPIKEVIELIKELPLEINKMLYYIHRPGYYSKSRQINILSSMLTDKNFKEFIKVAATTKEINMDTEIILKEKMEDIKIPEAEVGLSIISTWASIVNPRLFMPLHGHVPSKEFREIAERTFGIRLAYGGGWRKHIYDYLEFLRKINQIKSDLGINTTFEAAFYLSKFSKELIEKREIPQKASYSYTQNLVGYLKSKGYHFFTYLVSQFYTALKTKGFVILSGLTGTGKTKIAQELAELLDDSKKNLLFLPVRPDWRDSKALLGYYNPLTGEYQRTQLLDFILKAIEDYDKNRENAMPYFVILDEMNLAHVEYYFADFLSVLESGRDDDGFTRESIKLHDNDAVETFQGIPRELKLPPNLYIVGTVNMDETTYSFSPKVLDRAFVVEFHDVELEEYPPEKINLSDEEVEKLRNAVLDDLRGEKGKFLARSKEEINKAVRELKDTEYWRVLIELNKALEPYDMHFGYRVVDEIALFFQSARESWKSGIVEFENDDEIFDLALLMKVLPKFHGNRKKLEEPLKVILVECLRQENNSPVKFRVSFTERANTRTLELSTDIDKLNREAIIEMLTNWEKYENNFRFKHTARKVLRMLRQLYEIGFASFS